MAPIIGLAVPLIDPICKVTKGDYNGALDDLAFRFAGINRNQNNQFEWGGLVQGYGPLAVGLLVHKFIGGKPLNANAMLAKAKIPYIRI